MLWNTFHHVCIHKKGEKRNNMEKLDCLDRVVWLQSGEFLKDTRALFILDIIIYNIFLDFSQSSVNFFRYHGKWSQYS